MHIRSDQNFADNIRDSKYTLPQSPTPCTNCVKPVLGCFSGLNAAPPHNIHSPDTVKPV